MRMKKKWGNIKTFRLPFNSLLQYIRQCLSKGEIPQLCLYSRRDVYASLPESELHMPSYMRRTPIPIPTPTGASLISLWQLNTLFRVHILWATYVNVRDVDMIYVRAGIYHGQEVISDIFSIDFFK
jgi:phosphatidylinositol-4,5-bisphosphate 3-kinase